MRVVLYGNGLFGSNDDPATNQTQLAQLQASGFNTIVLWTIHVDSVGTLKYNDDVIVENGELASGFSYLPPLLAELRSSSSGTPSTVSTILFSIGAGGPPTPTDWSNINTLLQSDSGAATLQQNFLALAASLGIDGFDYDMEATYISDAITQLTQLLCTPNQQMITFCPYYDGEATFWADCLPVIYTFDTQQSPVPYGQSVQWLNLQCYGGGTVSTFQSAVSGVTSSAGIGDANTFVVPGLAVSSAGQYVAPSSIQTSFYSYAQNYDVTGGFLWNSEAIFNSSYAPSAYASAIINGIQAGGASMAKTSDRRKSGKKPAAKQGNRGQIRVTPPEKT